MDKLELKNKPQSMVNKDIQDKINEIIEYIKTKKDNDKEETGL